MPSQPDTWLANGRILKITELNGINPRTKADHVYYSSTTWADRCWVSQGKKITLVTYAWNASCSSTERVYAFSGKNRWALAYRTEGHRCMSHGGDDPLRRKTELKDRNTLSDRFLGWTANAVQPKKRSDRMKLKVESEFSLDCPCSINKVHAWFWQRSSEIKSKRQTHESCWTPLSNRRAFVQKWRIWGKLFKTEQSTTRMLKHLINACPDVTAVFRI